MRKLLLGFHATLVALALGYYALAVTVYATPDANIGAGLGLVALGLLGTPWSWPLINGTLFDTWGFFFLVAGTALLNLGLHSAVDAWWRRRSSRAM